MVLKFIKIISNFKSGFFTDPFLLGLIFFLLAPNFLLAATSDFNIKALVGTDTTPPSTPVLLSVEPVATNQIDVSWSTATDNIFLAGYVLRRDGVAIATTTTTTFLDGGLSPETLYSYDVYAFDNVGNLSTTSNVLATTTWAIVVPPVISTSTTGSATNVFQAQNLNIVTETNRAIFSWTSSLPSRYALRWGRDDAYSDGYIISDLFRSQHETAITGLIPGTIYFYELIGYTGTGRSVVLSRGEFKTKTYESLAPVNVSQFTYQIFDNDVALSWSLPEAVFGTTVRIVRNHLGYPTDLYDGEIVYEGKQSFFYDIEALNQYQTQYYTAFVIDPGGNVSSGVVLKVEKVIGNEIVSDPEIEELIIELPDFAFDQANIYLYQENKEYSFASSTIVLLADRNFLISIPYEALPQHLKSIILHLPKNDEGTRQSYLLRINQNKTAYEAVVPAVGQVGAVKVKLEIFDFQAQIVARYTKLVEFVAPKKNDNQPVVFPDKAALLSQAIMVVSSLMLVVLVLFAWLFWRNKKRAEDKQ